MTSIAPRPAADYAALLSQLLPRGAAWKLAPGGVFAALIDALAQEFARVDGRVAALREEADPRDTLELLPDWERVAALPDTCTGAPDNVGERQVALHQKLVGVGGQSRAAIAEIAARLGYLVDIEEHSPSRMGMRVGERLNGEAWAFAWTLHIRPFDGYLEEAEFVAQFTMGDRMGTRLRGFGALDLECVVGRAAPAHTATLFAYEVEPTPALWFDFTN